MLIKQIWLSFLGFCSGVTVSAGVFGFITMLGIIPRMAARTRTASHIYAYEQAIILGGTLGNLWILFQWHLPLFYHPVWLVFRYFCGMSGDGTGRSAAGNPHHGKPPADTGGAAGADRIYCGWEMPGNSVSIFFWENELTL